MRWNGILGVYEARTGTRAYQQRLGAGATAFTASPVASGGHLYFATEDGEVYVIKAGPAYELLATNKLDAAIGRGGGSVPARGVGVPGRTLLTART